jgi:prevent-host-death family protein
MATKLKFNDNVRWEALRKVNASTARQEIADLIGDAERGERVILTRNGKPKVAIVPLADLALLLHRDSEVEKRMVDTRAGRQPSTADNALEFEDFIAAASTPAEQITDNGVEGPPIDDSGTPAVQGTALHLATVVLADLFGKMSEAAVAGAVKRLDQSNSLAVEEEREIQEEVLECMGSAVIHSEETEIQAEAAEAG